MLLIGGEGKLGGEGELQDEALIGAAASGALGRGEEMHPGQVRLVLSVASVQGNYEEIQRVSHEQRAQL